MISKSPIKTDIPIAGTISFFKHIHIADRIRMVEGNKKLLLILEKSHIYFNNSSSRSLISAWLLGFGASPA
jgi:hypothetical protein